MKFLIALLLSFQVTAWAGFPTDFDPQQWNRLVDTTAEKGEMSHYANGTLLTLSRIVPNDLTKTHQADYFSLIGAIDINGDFRPDHAEAVSEAWVLNAKDVWEIDQWIFLMDLSGNVRKNLHRRIQRTQDGMIRGADTIPETEAQSLAQWNLLLKSWIGGL